MKPMTDYTTIESWDQPRSGLFKVVVNAWWVTSVAGEPLFYGKQKAPQCNQNKWIAEQVAKGRPFAQIPVVYIPIDPRDYC